MEITLTGQVVKGLGYGKKLGFPTANIDRKQYSRRSLTIRLGIYGGIVELPNKKRYPAGIVVGPLDKAGLPKIEAYLIDFSGSLYGKKLVIVLKKYLRSFKPYKSEDSLREQIASDIHQVRQLNLLP